VCARPALIERLQRWYAREPRFALSLTALLRARDRAAVSVLDAPCTGEARARARGRGRPRARILMAQTPDKDQAILQHARRLQGAAVRLLAARMSTAPAIIDPATDDRSQAAGRATTTLPRLVARLRPEDRRVGPIRA
jgi:hypothetical protein